MILAVFYYTEGTPRLRTPTHSLTNQSLGESFKYERRNRQGALRAHLYQKLTDYRNKNIASNNPKEILKKGSRLAKKVSDCEENLYF